MQSNKYSMFGLETDLLILLIFCLALAVAFEFVNGFHDTANAVATVIYTNSLKPLPAVIWSGIWNAIGVFVGGISVAMGIVNLLPVETLIDQNIWHSVSMVLALLLTAIIWNLGTWYFGIPCSSSHTLIGSILGVGLAFSLLPDANGVSVNWTKAYEIGVSLFVSPLVGFGLTIFLMFLAKTFIKDKSLFVEPPKDKTPPFFVRLLLLLTCTGVSFSHGSNDGQKGVGLVMLILIGIVPTYFALDHSVDPRRMAVYLKEVNAHVIHIDEEQMSTADKNSLNSIRGTIGHLDSTFVGITSIKDIPKEKHFEIRKDILLITRGIDKLKTAGSISLDKIEMEELASGMSGLRKFTDYSPFWVILMIAISLGLGTMIGWKRVVITIGEKIGKQHLTYAQGASAEMVAASTIGISTFLGLPVSTTHILSSGIAGSMVASKGLGNLQMNTTRNILIAWLLTLPVCILLSGGLFLLFRFFL